MSFFLGYPFMPRSGTNMSSSEQSPIPYTSGGALSNGLASSALNSFPRAPMVSSQSFLFLFYLVSSVVLPRKQLQTT